MTEFIEANLTFVAILRDLIIVIFGSGVVVGFLSWWKDSLRDRRVRTDERDYLALRLANRFEEYGVACAKSISDHNLAIQTGGHAGQNVQFIIDAPELIDSDAYKYFDKTLYDRILQFSQDRALAEMGAMFLWDVTADHDEVKDAMLKGTAKMGALASTLAKDIRQSCSLPARALSFGNTSVEKLFEKAVTALD